MFRTDLTGCRERKNMYLHLTNDTVSSSFSKIQFFTFILFNQSTRKNERNKGKYLNQEKNVKHKEFTFYYLLSLKGIISFNFLNRFRIISSTDCRFTDSIETIFHLHLFFNSYI